jgi:hypothetical protein
MNQAQRTTERMFRRRVEVSALITESEQERQNPSADPPMLA